MAFVVCCSDSRVIPEQIFPASIGDLFVIRVAIGDEKDPDKACKLNVMRGVKKNRDGFASHPGMADIDVRGAVYDIVSGNVVWL